MKTVQILLWISLLVLSTKSYGEELPKNGPGFHHKYVLKTMSIYYKHPRDVDHENIDHHIDELRNIDELTAFANLIELNQAYIEKAYVRAGGKYPDMQTLLSAMVDGWFPRVDGVPVVPTNFGRRVIKKIGTRMKLDFYIDMLVANDVLGGN